MSKFRDIKFSSLKEYVPGEQPRDKRYIKLNTNESPFPPSKSVIEALNENEISTLNLYSDPECKILKEKIAEIYDVKKENVFVSNGSDEILNFAFMLYGANGASFPEITYGFYKVFCDLYGIKYNAVPLKDDFTIDAEDYKNLGHFIVIANPNAPTGIELSLEKIREILDSNRSSVVLIDEAYVDFGGKSALSLLSEYDNLIVSRTFSKSRSLAGARLGFAIASRELIADLELIRNSTNPYNINTLTQRAGKAALDEDWYYTENCKIVAKVREETKTKLENLGFYVLPSKANFLFARSEKISGEKLYLVLKSRGFLVRHFDTEKIKDFNRITIGTKEDMLSLVNEIKLILEEEK